MNLTSPAEAENCHPRRVSNPSERLIDISENPLMTLVDAASMLQHPSTSIDQDAKQKDDGSDANEVVSVTDSNSAREDSSCSSLSSDEHKSGNDGDEKVVKGNEGKVVVGTKADLFDSTNKKPTFPEDLMAIIDNEANSDVLAWMPDGESFTIVNHRLFAFERMSKLFNIRNMSSFVRKLTRWGFSRVHEKKTRNSDIFKHKYFKRGRKDLVKRIRCVYRPLVRADTTSSFPSLITPITDDIRDRGHEYAMPNTPDRSQILCQPHLIHPSPGVMRTISGGGHHSIQNSPAIAHRVVPQGSYPSYPSSSPRSIISSPRYNSTGASTAEPAFPFENVFRANMAARIEALHRDTYVSAQLNRDLIALRSAREQAILRSMHTGTTRSPGTRPQAHYDLAAPSAQSHQRLSTSAQHDATSLFQPNQPAWARQGRGHF